MTLRIELSDGEETIPFAQIGERYMKNQEFMRILSDYPDFLNELMLELKSSQGDIMRMAICVRELMCIDMISKITNWGSLTPHDMTEIQGGFSNIGDAFMSYENFQNATGLSQPEIDKVTLQIQDLDSRKKINKTVGETKDGANIIRLVDWRRKNK